MISLGSCAAFLALYASSCSAFVCRTRRSRHPRASSSYSASENLSVKTIESSPWAAADWKITFNIGREAGTLMPDEWGSMGGRLVFDLPVEITSDRPTSSDKLDPVLQRNSFRLTPLSDSKYVTMEGEQRFTFEEEGGWKIRLPTGKANGEAAKLMCFVDLKSDIEKNDIFLKRGERIYLIAKCWREEELERALKRLQPIHTAFMQKQKRLIEALEHETGDRRLDGKDPIQTMMGMKDTAQLVIERDEAWRVFQEANVVYPTVDINSDVFPDAENLEWQEGPWPGQIEWLTIEPLYMMVRRKKLLLGEEYHVIGTWAAAPVLED
eukprot:scaffold22560_cov135-Cylindrotheca_fusiformis.AAC.59